MAFRITVVCSGNICRSPIAESVLRARFVEAGLDVEVSSGGTGAWHLGQDADPRATRALRVAGYSLTHAARQVERSWFAEHDLLLALDSEHYRDLRRLAPDLAEQAKVRMLREFAPECSGVAPPDRRLDVPDPYYGSDADFTKVLEMVESAADGVVAEVTGRVRG